MNKLSKILGLGALVVVLDGCMSCYEGCYGELNKQREAQDLSIILARQQNNTILGAESILTISAKDYAEGQGKKLSDYNMVGIRCSLDWGPSGTYSYTCSLDPKTGANIEAVVETKFNVVDKFDKDFWHASRPSHQSMIGIAMILKPEAKR